MDGLKYQHVTSVTSSGYNKLLKSTSFLAGRHLHFSGAGTVLWNTKVKPFCLFDVKAFKVVSGLGPPDSSLPGPGVCGARSLHGPSTLGSKCLSFTSAQRGPPDRATEPSPVPVY